MSSTKKIKSAKYVALVDCNNFYVSCERVFNPQLKNKPVVVLSNNDGCVIARSAEAKALDIGMAVPAFKIQQQIRQHQIKVYSSNYALYGDMSARVMAVLELYSPQVEIYSIDEAFLDLSWLDYDELYRYGQKIRQKIATWLGIPVSIGIATTKTLAKVSSRLAKNSQDGIYVFPPTAKAGDLILQKVEVEDIWGVGKQLSKWLRVRLINNALSLKQTPEYVLQPKMGVLGIRLLRELSGVVAIPLESIPQPKQSTCVSRSFRYPATTIGEMKQAIATYAIKLGEKLRQQQQNATTLTVFIQSDRFQANFYSNSITLSLPVASNLTPTLINCAFRGLIAIYHSQYAYKKAGIIAQGLTPESVVQGNLFVKELPPQAKKLMQTIDRLNAALGQNTITFAVAKLKSPEIKQTKVSPRYTTCWQELPIVKAHSTKAHR
ncbi:MAG: Y-family DNA polymerase [Cyanobacteria bacterium P01_C01_bin.72]